MVRGWRSSGQSAPAYAARAGVSASSLHRWASLVGAATAEAPRLVEVVPSDGGGSSWGWEVALASGTLRVRGDLEPKTARAIVEALASGRRR